MTALAWALGLPRWVKLAAVGVIALALLTAIYIWMGAREAADDTANQAIGAAVQRETDLTETINRVEQGNEARQEIERETVRGGGNAVYDQCLRSARNPAQCARYLLHERADD